MGMLRNRGGAAGPVPGLELTFSDGLYSGIRAINAGP